MAEPGNEVVTGADDRLRASHGDRERAIDVLKTAFTQGMLAKDEFDLRVGQALTSRTRADLNALTADIPAGLTKAQPPEAARESGNKPARKSKEQKAVRAAACTTVAVLSTARGIMALMEHHSDPYVGVVVALLATLAIACLLAVPASGLVMLQSWLGKRALSNAGVRPTP